LRLSYLTLKDAVILPYGYSLFSKSSIRNSQLRFLILLGYPIRRKHILPKPRSVFRDDFFSEGLFSTNVSLKICMLALIIVVMGKNSNSQ